jgi:hypothetical protein
LKILFICSSLEPGCDGVGDYTRRLACELIRQGHFVEAISLNDKHISGQCLEVQTFDSVDLPVLRFPLDLPLAQKLNIAKKHIGEFNPDWISLQFVIFGYHPKGLPLWLSKLATLGKNRRWHIMFHELWIGMARESSKKEKYWGLVQKYLIKKMVSDLNPKLITTQSSLYKAQLSRVNIESYHLPLFGNIPVAVSRLDEIPLSKNDVTLVVFGTIHPGAPVKQFVEEAIVFKQKNNINISIKLIGRSGGELNNWVSVWQDAGFLVEVLGEQTADVISATLFKATIGISTSAYSMIEKSGTVAAMREHGLNVICVAKPYHPNGILNLPPPEGVFEYKAGNFEECISHNSKLLSKINAAYVAKLFAELLATKNIKQ